MKANRFVAWNSIRTAPPSLQVFESATETSGLNGSEERVDAALKISANGR